MWAKYFRYTYCILDNTLIIKGVAEDDPDVTAFSMPIGPMPIGPMPLRRSVALIERYCHSHRLPVVFSAIPEDRLAEFMSIHPGMRYSELADWSDYIYRIETLATLRGKKMNKKRNHVNRFIGDHPDYTVDTVNAEMVDELEAMTGRTSDSMTPLAVYERRQCQDTLRMLPLYGFESAVLRTAPGAPVCAYAAGEVIGDTLYTHIEKADHSVAGAGEMINMIFARRMLEKYPGLQYVNREEDTGDEGLRHAKLSYHPTALLRKYNIFL